MQWLNIFLRSSPLWWLGREVNLSSHFGCAGPGGAELLISNLNLKLVNVFTSSPHPTSRQIWFMPRQILLPLPLAMSS